MSSDDSKFICGLCSKQLANKYNLAHHMKTIHLLSPDGTPMDVEVFPCSSNKCQYSTKNESDLRKHQHKCPHVLFDREVEMMQGRFQTEFAKQFELLNASLTAQFAAEQQAMTTEFAQEKQNLIAEFAVERHHLTAQLHEYSQTIAKQQVEIDMLRQQLDKAYDQVDQSQKDMKQLAEKAIARPTVQTNNHATVKISNYLANHDTYRRQTERDFIVQQANAHLQQYIEQWVNGQEALAKFVVAHIIKRADSNEYILCCTDTSRKRFLYINHLGEREEDMLAKLFVSQISGPIREVSGAIFRQIEDRLQQERQSAKGGEKLTIDNKILVTNDKYLKMMEFDISDKNGDFIAELAGMLRGTNAIEG
jgi:hypothetical protein